MYIIVYLCIFFGYFQFLELLGKIIEKNLKLVKIEFYIEINIELWELQIEDLINQYGVY